MASQSTSAEQQSEEKTPWWKFEMPRLTWASGSVCILLVELILVALSFPTARVTKYRCGSFITSGDSMMYNVPWGSIIFALPLACEDGDLVVALTEDGVVVKRLGYNCLISEGSNGRNYPKGTFQILGKVVWVSYTPLYQPKGSAQRQLTEGVKSFREDRNEAVAPRSTGGVFPGHLMPRGPMGQLWLTKPVRFSFSKAFVELEGKRYSATIIFENPGGGNGHSILRLTPEPGGIERDVNITITPA